MGTVSLKLLFSFAAIFAVAVKSDLSQICKYHSPYDIISLDEVKPEMYNIVYTVTNGSLIAGKTTITFSVHRTTNRIMLHTYYLAIDIRSMKLTKWSSLNQSNIIFNWNHVYCYKAQVLQLNLEQNIFPAVYSLDINFLLPVKVEQLQLHNKYLWSPTIREELNSARKVFPCLDDPGARAQFEITVKHSAYYMVLSNMPVLSRVDEKDGLRRTSFMKTPLIAPREVGIALTQYLNQNSSSRIAGVNIWNREQMDNYFRHMLFAIEKSKKTFDRYIVEHKEMSKTDHIIIPNLPVKIKRYPGLVIYREQHFTYDQSSDHPGRKSDILNLLGQEVARQWFGGDTNPSSWSDLWLIDSFASFLNHIVTEKLQNEQIKDLYAVQMMQFILHQNRALKIKPVLHEINIDDRIERDLYFPMYSKKGAVLIRMLYYLFPANEFQLAIRTYFSEIENISFKPDNLWKYLQRHIDAVKKEWPYKVKEIMNKWLTLEDHLEVYVHRFKNNTVYISTNCTSNSDDIPIPITYITQTNLTSGYNWNVIWLKCWENKTIPEIDKYNFILVNLEQSGYYRVNYDTGNWNKLSNFLMRGSYVLIPAVNRAQIVDDAFYFLMQRKITFTTFNNIILFLARDTNYVAWYPMFNIISRMSTYLKLLEGRHIKWSIKIYLEFLLDAIGYEESYHENDMLKSLRLLAVRWACKLDSTKCKIAATVKLTEFLKDPSIPIPSWWKEWVYCTGMENANWYTWQTWMNMCIKEEDKTCLTYLACTSNTDILEHYFAMILGTKEMDKFMKEVGTQTLFHTLFEKQVNNDIILASSINNMDEINTKIFDNYDINTIKLFTKAIRTVHSKKNLNLVKSFVEKLKFIKFNETLKRQFHEMIRFRYKEFHLAAVQFNFLK